VRNTVKKINAAKGKASQGRLESFFGPVTVKPSAGKAKAAEAAAAAAKGKGGKGGGTKGGLAAKGGVKKAPISAGKKK
jgi:flap endonuclease-1